MADDAPPTIMANPNTSYVLNAKLLQPKKIHRHPPSPKIQKATKDFFRPTVSDRYFVAPENSSPATYMTNRTAAMYLFGRFRVLLTKNGVYISDAWKNDFVVM